MEGSLAICTKLCPGSKRSFAWYSFIDESSKLLDERHTVLVRVCGFVVDGVLAGIGVSIAISRLGSKSGHTFSISSWAKLHFEDSPRHDLW